MSECVWGVKVMVQWGQVGEREGTEFSLLTAWWTKLFFSLVVLDLRLRNRRVKRQVEGWVGSPTMLSALRVRRVL